VQKVTLKIAAVFLCGLLIYNSLGYFMVLSVMRVAVQHQKWAELSTLPENKLTTFVFGKNEQNTRLRIVNNREIQVDGKLYDIVRKVEDGSKITYHCMHDSKEEKLVAQTRLFNSMAQPMPIKNTTRIILNNIIKYCVIDSHTSIVKQISIPYYPIIKTVTYYGPVISILVPPPQKSC
jgi:hypothetical protein